MSTPTEPWKNWEGKVVDGKFTLQRWLGGSDHSAVFLTERSGATPQKAVIKLIPAAYRDSPAQLSHWSESTRLLHPHLIRLFEYGRWQIDDTPLLYVVEECADENLAEIIPLRPLSSNEVLEMLRPAAEGLAFLHEAGFVHGHVKPSNIMAIGNELKLSADGLRRFGETDDTRRLNNYKAPEVASALFTSASDMWSLGATSLAVLTQVEPKSGTAGSPQIAVPQALPQPIRRIVERCLQIEPGNRSSASEILKELSPRRFHDEAATNAGPPGLAPEERSRRWMAAPILILAVLLLLWIGSKFLSHEQAPPGSEAGRQGVQPNDSNAKSPAPSSAQQQIPPQKGTARGGVIQRVMPEVSPNALHTVTGRLKVGVRVAVDSSGNVASAKLSSPGPSQYFSARALAAARQWKFSPPQVNGQAVASNWVLRFQFSRASVQVNPSEINP
jgi:TonB family protein